jgi:hypothetical protein
MGQPHTLWISSKGNSPMPYKRLPSRAAAVREGERIFKLLYAIFGDRIEGILVQAKPTKGEPRMLTDVSKADTTKARLYYRNGLVDHFEDQAQCYALWLRCPYPVFRGANDITPVYSWEFHTP